MRWFVLLLCACGVAPISVADTTDDDALTREIHWSGYRWTVKDGSALGPGPNEWRSDNVWIDQNGWLHVQIKQVAGRWTCAEIVSVDRFGFGTYDVQLVGRVDQMDPQAVLGMFNYAGPDGANEIDIELSRWGNPFARLGNYTVYPSLLGLPFQQHKFNVRLKGTYTTHRYTRRADGVSFESVHGHYPPGGGGTRITSWTQRGSGSQEPMPFMINLWLYQGRAPQQPVELVIRQFRYK